MLIDSCASFAKEGWQQATRDLARFLLCHQYVKSFDDQGILRLFRVVRGAGQGLCCSGSVANASYAATVEVPFFALLTDDGQSMAGGFYDVRA